MGEAVSAMTEITVEYVPVTTLGKLAQAQACGDAKLTGAEMLWFLEKSSVISRATTTRGDPL